LSDDERAFDRKQPSLGLLGWRSLNAIGHHPVSEPACELSSFKLSASQTRICQLYPDHMDSVDAGARLGADECRYQTEWRRWNCGTPSNSSLVDSATTLGNAHAVRTYSLILIDFI